MIKNLRVSLSITLVMLAICMFAPRTGFATNITSTITGGNWSATTTWVGATVPVSTDDVTIANGATVTIDGIVSCANLTVGQGTSGILTFDGTARTFTVNGSVTVATGASFNAGTANTTHTVNIGGSANNNPYTGNLTVNGTLDFYVGASNGKANITFFGLPNALISGTTGTINFNTGNILNKGAVTATASVTPPVLDIQRAFTVQGGNALGFLTTHTAGVLKIGGTFTGSNPLYATATYAIPKLGGLWLDNPNFTITGLAGNSTNNGLLKISNGNHNIGTATGNAMGGATGSVFIFEGGTTNIAGRLDVPSNSCTLVISGSAVINVSTVGNRTSNTRGFGFTSGLNTVSITGGTINLVQAGATGYSVNGANPVVSGATLNVGTSATTAGATFMISGIIPNLVIDNTTNTKTVWLMGATINGTTTINAGSTLDLKANQINTFRSTITNNGTLTCTGNSGLASPAQLIFQGSVPQTLGGTITFLNNAIGLLVIDNAAGVTITPSVSLSALTLTSGTLACGGTLTLGNGGATGFDFTKANGSFSVLPTINYGTGRKTFTYNGAVSQITGIELPELATDVDSRLTINNPAGVILNSPLSVLNLTLSSGVLTTTLVNVLKVTGNIVRTSGYVNGPLVRSLQASLPTGYTYLWPLGKSAYTPFELVNPTTNAGGTVDIQAEVFDTNSGGTAGSGMGNLNDRHWESSITANSGNFIGTTVRVTNETTIPTLSVLGRSATKTGIYDQVGNTINGATILSNSLSELGFFAIGTVAAACNNPATGGTIAEDQIGCGSFDPTLITSAILPDAGTGTLEYKWQYSVSPFNTWTDINSNTETYDPGVITETTIYKRLARVDCKTNWVGAAESNVVTMSINTTTITTANTASTCSGTSPNINLEASIPSTFTWTVGTITGDITGAFDDSGSAVDQLLTNPSLTDAGTVEYIVTPTSEAGLCVGAPYSIIVTVNPTVEATISINDPGSVCVGNEVTLTTITANGGNSPTYQWYLNYFPESTSASYTFTPVNGDLVYVVMTSSNPCASPGSLGEATSNTQIMALNEPGPAAVSIQANQSYFCENVPVTFTAVTVNGGSAPAYVWYVNGDVQTGETSATFTYLNPEAADEVYVELTSNSPCATTAFATSEIFTIVLSPLINPGVTIEVSQNPICADNYVSITATPSGLGAYSGPLTYEWFVNGSSQYVSDQNIFDYYYPLDGDQVYVVMGGFNCTVLGNTSIQSANTITMEVKTASSAVISSGDVTICAGASTDLTIDLTGTGPWDVTYTDGSFDDFGNPILFYENNINSSPLSITVTPDSTTTYTLMSVTGANICTYYIYSTATVTVNPLPDAASAIAGSATFSPGDTGVPFSVDLIANVSSYTWSYSGTGVTITGTDNNVVLDFAADATSGTLSVFGSNACGNGATSSLYILSITDKFLDLKVFLEGAFDSGTSQMKTTLNTDLVIPTEQPFGGSPWNYAGSESALDPIPADVVDWILVELREAETPELATSGTILSGWPKPFLLKSDGTIVDLDGASMPNIGRLDISNKLYVVIRHRNHLAIMSATGATADGAVYSYDFTTGLEQAYGSGNGYKAVSTTFAMVSGDIDNDGNIFVSDYNKWAVGFGTTAGYFNSDLDMDGNVFVSDYNKWAINFGSTIVTGLKSAQTRPKYFSAVPK